MQGVLDNLSYAYLDGGHKLGSVTDNTTDAAGFNDLNKTGDDYTYDVNGNLTLDRNKRLGVTYNMLNLPELVTRTTDSKNIQYAYDATGRKLKKIYNGLTHYYVDGIEYSGDTLLFIASEEGRVRKQGTSWVYDYFLKDHLGNVRVMLTSAPSTQDSYPPATMESANSTVEETFYANLPQTRTAKPVGFDSNTGNTSVAKVSSSVGMKKVGPSVTLKVNAGDKLSLSTKSFYKTSEANYNRNPLVQEMLNLLLNGLVNPTGGTGQTATVAREIASNQIFGTSTYSGTLSSIAPGIYNTTADGAPKAYMVWTLFDNEFNLVKSSSGMLRVPNTPDVLKNLSQLDITMERGGYFYAYLVNESSMNVYFDDFQVTHNTGKVLEENHYYPFGMLNAQLSVQPTDKPLNYYKYNGKELQKELNLEWLDYGARFYDAQVGRWHVIDNKSEKYYSTTPYSYAVNSPINAIDPDGNVVIFVNGMHGGSGGSAKYWNGLDTRVMNRIGDRHARYYDGSNGGAWNISTRGILTGNNLIPGNRRRAGERAALKDASTIYNNLEEGESIKLVSHSMGGAYAKGFIKGLKKYAKEQGISINVEIEVDLANFQSGNQKAEDGVPTTQISHDGDPVAGTEELEGAKNVTTRNGKHKSLDEHSVDSFTQKEINEHIPVSTNNAPGSSTWEEKPKK